jgi:O-antigen biosynthesis protein WbqP
MKRLFDLILTLIAFCVFAVPIVLVGIAVKVSSRGPILFWSYRVGRHNVLFSMPKFRTMQIGTPAIASHLLHNPQDYQTPIGPFLRKTSLDELPQLWSILIGDMSLVGPRPALFNQKDLVELRTKAGVSVLMPGITGWAQVNGRDKLSIPDKVALDIEYLKQRSLRLDIKILGLTLLKVIRREGVSH